MSVEWRAAHAPVSGAHEGYRWLTFSRDSASGRCFYGLARLICIREITLREIQLPLKNLFASPRRGHDRRILLAELARSRWCRGVVGVRGGVRPQLLA